MNCLVTGGAGFIGSSIAEELSNLNHEVTILDNFSTGKQSNLESFKDKINIVKGSVTDKELVSKACKNIDTIFHLAAMVSVPLSIQNPLECSFTNLKGTLNIIRAATKNNSKIIFASSSAVYGDRKGLPKKEDMETQAISPYGLSKLSAEKYFKIFHELYGLKYCAFRYFNVFGPKQDPKSDYAAVIPLFINKMLNNEPPKIFGNGEQTRDFVFVKDVVRANIKAMQSDVSGIFNIGSGKSYTVNQLVQTLNKIMDKNLQPKYLEEREGDIVHSYSSIEKANQKLGFRPSIDFEEGLRQTVEWFKK